MNKANGQTQGQTKPNPLQASGILQRKCACGNHVVASGECAECAKKEHSLQRKTANHAKPNRDTSLSVTPVIQRKLTIGKSDDPLEQEADRIADQVLAASPSSIIGGVPPRIQRFTAQPAGQTGTAPASVDRVLASSGHPLEPSLRQDMEQRFGHDFSGVRVHTGGAARQSARDVNANAYTVGNNVVFGANQYAPETQGGRRLIAHELTHVVQQASLSSSTSFHPLSSAIGQENSVEKESNTSAVRNVSRNAFADPVGQHPFPFTLQRAPVETTAEPEPAEEETVMQRLRAGVETVVEGVRTGGETAVERARAAGRRVKCWLGRQENPVVNPITDISTFQSPGASGWRGAKFGCFREVCTRRHKGWDFHAPVGTPIRAVVTGKMTPLNGRDYGKYVMLASTANPKRKYRYAHLSKREPAGDYCVGDKLGETGVTGNAEPDRPHLHFEVRENGTAVDPAPFLTEPNQVVEATGSAITAIDKTLAPPCNPC